MLMDNGADHGGVGCLMAPSLHLWSADRRLGGGVAAKIDDGGVDTLFVVEQ